MSCQLLKDYDLSRFEKLYSLFRGIPGILAYPTGGTKGLLCWGGTPDTYIHPLIRSNFYLFRDDIVFNSARYFALSNSPLDWCFTVRDQSQIDQDHHCPNLFHSRFFGSALIHPDYQNKTSAEKRYYDVVILQRASTDKNWEYFFDHAYELKDLNVRVHALQSEKAGLCSLIENHCRRYGFEFSCNVIDSADMNELYNQARSFVMFSQFEGNNRALLDALVCGCIPLIWNHTCTTLRQCGISASIQGFESFTEVKELSRCPLMLSPYSFLRAEEMRSALYRSCRELIDYELPPLNEVYSSMYVNFYSAKKLNQALVPRVQDACERKLFDVSTDQINLTHTSFFTL